MPSPTPALPATNLSVLVGTLSRPPVLRDLASGDQLVSLEVTTRPASGPADTVPVAWFSAPPSACSWEAGQDVVVVGRVRRRFFRSASTTQSRVEVLASSVVSANRRSAARKALAAALEDAAQVLTG